MTGQGGHTRGLYGPKQARSWRPTRSVPDRVCRPGTTPGLGCITREELLVWYPQPAIVSGRSRSGRSLPMRPLSAPAGGVSDTVTAMYRSAPQSIIPQERCDQSPAITAPVPMEVRENRTISRPPVGVLLSHPPPVQPIKESKSDCLSLLAATHQPDGRAVARELPLMLVGFLLVCATVLAKYSGKTACEPNPSAGCAAELTKAGCKTCVGADAAQTCTECTTSGYKVQLDKRSCGPTCPAHSTASSNVCECDQGYTLNAGKTACVAASNTQCNTPNCKACDNPKTDSEICTECNDGNYLTPTKQCTQSCGAIGSYYNGNKVCEPCDPSCAACTTTGPAKCTLCPPGKMLKYTNDDPSQGGSCVDECKPQSGASGCETCGATIGGTRYCSKCSTSTEVPVNGVCTADNARAPVCSKKDNQGGCATCASGYFRQDNGCYKTDRQPGIQICTLASQGDKCETCANSLPPSAAGVCPSCDSACKTCTSANNANTCSSCVVGYYQVGTKCVRCDTNDPNGNKPITGVRDCVSCAPPAGGDGGSVLCYLMKDGDSTNKSGLSTGAIAGISVAVVVVVGGLVGFLCWWFICRGKA